MADRPHGDCERCDVLETSAAQAANAERLRAEALDAALAASEDRDGYRIELARVSTQVRDLEVQLRAERHEHAETRARAERLAGELTQASAESARLHRALEETERAGEEIRQRNCELLARLKRIDARRASGGYQPAEGKAERNPPQGGSGVRRER